MKYYITDKEHTKQYIISRYQREQELDQKPFTTLLYNMNRNELIEILYLFNNEAQMYSGIERKYLMRMTSDKIRKMIKDLINREYGLNVIKREKEND